MDFDKTLTALKDKDLFRSLVTLPEAGGKFVYQGKEFLNFSSNDYLDFASNDYIKKVAKDAIDSYGTGSTGSRLMSGNLKIHQDVEHKIAAWMGYESCLIFGSGFLTNLGVITSLVSKKDYIFFDKLDHASLIDGIRLSGAKWKRFKHNSVADLENLLAKCEDDTAAKFVIVDSIFSMDGDIAPLRKIYDVAKKYNAFLIVDEAHAVGVFGENGAGCCYSLGIKPDVITGTFSKAFAGYGGFAVSSEKIRDMLINKARSFVYSTGLPPSCLGVVSASVDLIAKQKTLGDELLTNAKYFYDLLVELGFDLGIFESQIIPVVVRDNAKSVQLASKLMEAGLYVKAIRPPTVPINTARLRISITLAHTKEDLKKAADTIYAAAKELEII